MYNVNLVKELPELLMGKELEEALQILPEYNSDIVNENEATRLIALENLYKVFIPNNMSKEIYSKLYLALLHSLQKKSSQVAIAQINENAKAIRGKEYSSIMGGADAFTVIAPSGCGKSSCVTRAINLIMQKQVLEVKQSDIKIIPCVLVQCPWDSSIKGMLLEILRVIDMHLDTSYYTKALRAQATIDILIGTVSQVALRHIGLIVVDEIQNVVNSKNGKSLIGALTQLINNAGISIILVGTPESRVFFEQAFQLARRSLGLCYDTMEYGTEFKHFCEMLFQYQYVKNRTEINEGIIQWLYERSQGNLSIVVSLLHDSQELAILNGTETVNIEMLDEAYRKRLSLLHSFVSRKKKTSTAKIKLEDLIPTDTKEEEENAFVLISSLVMRAKNECRDVVTFLSDYLPVEKVMI